MQGIGAVVGSFFLLVLIYFSQQTHTVCDRSFNPGLNAQGIVPAALNTVWRSFLFIGFIFHSMVLLYRWLVLEESEDGIEKLKKRKAKRSAESKLTLRAAFDLYGKRLISTAGCCFLWVRYCAITRTSLFVSIQSIQVTFWYSYLYRNSVLSLFLCFSLSLSLWHKY